MKTSLIRHRIWVEKLPRDIAASPLSDDEKRHALTVLKLKPGETVEAIDGSGRSVFAKLRARDDAWVLEYDADQRAGRTASQNEVVPLTLIVGIPKAEAMEWLIEKATELGVSEIIPVSAQFSVVDVKKKGEDIFQTRWQKIADQALKQCERLTRMKVAKPRPLPVLLADLHSRSLTSTTFFAAETERSDRATLRSLIEMHPRNEPVRVLIGPEGGFSPNEIEQITRFGIRPVSLGPLILRTETAALYVASNWVDFFRNSK